jgi:hypothetical protein
LSAEFSAGATLSTTSEAAYRLGMRPALDSPWGRSAVQLPFTKDQFFDLLAAYNVGLWPALLALWIASVLVCVLLLSSRRPPDRWISALLAAHWAWSAIAYHAWFFTRINQAAWLFAALFLLQAAVFFWVGVVHGHLSFGRWRSAWAPVAWGLVAYSLVYPAINASECVENPDLRRAMPHDDLHGRHGDARHATFVAPVDRSCDLVSHRRIRGVPPGRTRRLRPPGRRHCTGDLLGAEDQRQPGIAVV